MMDNLFRMWRMGGATGSHVRSYLLYSTAPLNVEDKVSTPGGEGPTPDPHLTELPPHQALKQIAEFLNRSPNPQLVIRVHGYNTPTEVALKDYNDAHRFLEADGPIREQPGLVCVGYRWPSEKLRQPRGTCWSAAPLLMKCVFFFGVLCFAALCVAAFRPLGWWSILTVIAGLLAAVGLGLPLALLLLRTVAYFRDSYRATQYGVPDLVEFLRHLDEELTEETRDRLRQSQERVKLSFIGHSMGALVVTNVVRILSDVFGAQPSEEMDSPSTRDTQIQGDIGNSFCLERLVLVSPDIPAEALLSHRANFLGSSLRRFREAYLFSNEGDEVLRMISTLANYFMFPAKTRNRGLRLGNTEVVDPADVKRLPPYGIVNREVLAHGGEPLFYFLRRLRLGSDQLDTVEDALVGGLRSAGAGSESTAGDPDGTWSLEERFTFIDCTDYREDSTTYLTRGKRKAKLAWWNHLSLFLTYLSDKLPGHVDVHSGYFAGPFTRALIYRLACLGLAGTLEDLAPKARFPEQLEELDQQCSERNIQVLLSPWLYDRLTQTAREQPTQVGGLAESLYMALDPETMVDDVLEVLGTEQEAVR